jgi:hypothetical protein
MNEGVFLIGFSEEEVQLVRGALRDVSVHEVPRECLTWKLGEIVERRPDGRGDWHERRFLITHGGNELIKRVISAVRGLKLGRVIFISTTPISLERTLDDLIKEWIEEDEYFRAYRRSRMGVKGGDGPFLDIKKG